MNTIGMPLNVNVGGWCMIHLDFGAGELIEDLVGQFTDFDETQWTIIGVDRREPHKDPVFMHIMKTHYDRIGNGWIVKKDNKPPWRFYDMYIVDDIRSPNLVIPKANSWQCLSTMEHVPEEELQEVMEAFIDKLHWKSVGKMRIDLTDHRYYPSDEKSFLHYEDETFAKTIHKDFTGLYLNRVKRGEWKQLMDKWFVYEGAPDDNQYTVSLKNVKLKHEEVA